MSRATRKFEGVKRGRDRFCKGEEIYINPVTGHQVTYTKAEVYQEHYEEDDGFGLDQMFDAFKRGTSRPTPPRQRCIEIEKERVRVKELTYEGSDSEEERRVVPRRAPSKVIRKRRHEESDSEEERIVVRKRRHEDSDSEEEQIPFTRKRRVKEVPAQLGKLTKL